jgi:hypothetical protein
MKNQLEHKKSVARYCKRNLPAVHRVSCKRDSPGDIPNELSISSTIAERVNRGPAGPRKTSPMIESAQCTPWVTLEMRSPVVGGEEPGSNFTIQASTFDSNAVEARTESKDNNEINTAGT